ncbi:alpha/beta hydrolase, partial [Hydrogenimonas sp.]
VVLRGWWVPGSGERAVLLLHGKAGNRNGLETNIFELGRWYWERGYHVMMADMRGHGESGGKYVYFGVREHMDMLGWLRAFDPKVRYRWTLHGFSMGAVTALMMKDKEPARFERVVADAPWIDFDALVTQELWKRAKIPAFAYPYVKWVAKTFFGQSFKMADNVARVRRLCGQRVVYIFESDDALLPPLHRNLVKAKCPDATVKLFEGVGHVAAFKERPREYTAFLEGEGL